MDSCGVFSFLTVLKEAFKLVPKNGKLMALVALFSFLLSMIAYGAFGFSILSLAQDVRSVTKSFGRRSFKRPTLTPAQLEDQLHHIEQILAILYALEIASIVIFHIISFITTMATILISAASYGGNTLSTKDLFLRIARTWTKPFLTSIYVSIHALGFLAIIGLLAVPAVIYPNIVTTLISIFFVIVALLIYLYLLVIWALAIVISVVEQGCYGMAAMGKASQLVQGQRLKGYMLSLLYFLLTLFMLVIYHVIYRIKGPLSAIIYGLFMVGISYLAKILQVVAYTVLYFRCKKQHWGKPEIDIGVVKYELLLPTTYP